MMVVVTGATGLIGRALVGHLRGRGNRVVALVRDPDRVQLGDVELVRADLEASGPWRDALDGADAVVHLAGEPVAGKRWDARQKQILRDSRVETARNLVEAIGRARVRPRVLVSASGVDYYPFALDLADFASEPVTEADPAGEHFLARLCANWEAEAAAAARYGVRTVQMRTALVLAPVRDGGALARFAQPFVGRMGSGRQLVSWIHRDDVVAAYTAALDDARYVGPVNLAAGSIRQVDFARAIGRVLHRPAVLAVPAFALRLAVGELAESLLRGRNVVPAKLRELGFRFAFADLAAALGACLR